MKLLPFVRELKIVTKANQVVKLDKVINPTQIDLVETVQQNIDAKRPTRIIVLKARQMGISTVVEAMLFTMAFAIKRMRGLIVAHESPAAEHLLSMTTQYWDTAFFNDDYDIKWNSANRMSWRQTESTIKVATAKNTGSGRGQTIQFLHASEVGFWDNGELLMTGLRQAIPNVPGSFLFLESTANGFGNYFQQQWEAAESGESDLIPKFYPWWAYPEYTASHKYFPGDKNVRLTKLDDEEKVLVALLRTNGLVREDIRDRLIWRRWAIINIAQGDMLKFHQEYPSTAEEAFISTGNNVFNVESLQACYKPEEGTPGMLVYRGSAVDFIGSEAGPLKIFREPGNNRERDQYVAFGDPTRTTQGDWAVIQIVHRRTWEQVAVWRGRIDPATFGEEMIKIGKYYNDALLNVETTGPGQGTIAVLISHHYPFVWENQDADKHSNYTGLKFGWASTWQSKQELIGNAIQAVVQQSITIHDARTFREMKNYVTIDKGFGNSDGEDYDDCVTSLAGAITTIRYEAPSLKAYQLGDREFMPLKTKVRLDPEAGTVERLPGAPGVSTLEENRHAPSWISDIPVSGDQSDNNWEI